jgi:CRP/FNR family transcriptional regulator, cyclic AMP receptor protein
MDTLEPILAELPLLKGLRPEHLRLIVGCASNVRFGAGDFVFREGQEADTFYILRRGRVAIEMFSPQGGPITVETVSEGGAIGWSGLVPPHHRAFDVRAVELTRAIAFDAKCLRAKMSEDHELGYELLSRMAHVIAGRLRATRLQLLDIYGSHR